MNDAEIVAHAVSFGHGGMSAPELTKLMEICRNKKVLELGSMIGMSSYVIGNVAKSLDCVDVWSDTQEHLAHDTSQCVVYKALTQNIPNMYDAFTSNCGELIDSCKIKIHRGKTSDVVSDFADSSFDVIIFDADHSYFGVSNDFYNYDCKLRSDGRFLFHDYNDGMWTSIVKFCNEMIDAKRIIYVDNVERLAVFEKQF